MPNFLSYIVEHWHGQHSLFASFWYNCCLLSVVLVALILGANWLVTRRHRQGQNTWVWFNLSAQIVLMTVITIWMCVGLWRSADASGSEWAWWAKLLAWIGALSLPAGYYGLWSDLRPYFGDRQAMLRKLIERFNEKLAAADIEGVLALHSLGQINAASTALQPYVQYEGDFEDPADTGGLSLRAPLHFKLLEADILGPKAQLTLERHIGDDVDIVTSRAQHQLGDWAFATTEQWHNPPEWLVDDEPPDDDDAD